MDYSRKQLRVKTKTRDLALKKAENTANNEYQTRAGPGLPCTVLTKSTKVMQILVLAMIKLDPEEDFTN